MQWHVHRSLAKGGISLKKIIFFLICAMILSGCAGQADLTDRALALRGKLQAANGCAFDAVVTADYGDKTYTFAMGCSFDAHGNLSFTVVEPQSIAGITGTIDSNGGKLTFDSHMLAFPMLADGQVTPVSAPWLLYKTLVGGYFRSAVQEDALLHLQIDDSYEDHALQLDIWLGSQDLPVRAEILYQNRRVLTLTVENFQFL